MKQILFAEILFVLLVSLAGCPESKLPEPVAPLPVQTPVEVVETDKVVKTPEIETIWPVEIQESDANRPAEFQEPGTVTEEAETPPESAEKHQSDEPAEPEKKDEPDKADEVIEPNESIETEEVVSDRDNPKTAATIFHDKCSVIFNEFVNEDGLVDYSTLKRKSLILVQVARNFAKLDSNEYAAWPEADKIAFWINAYNIHMLKVVRDHYPIKPSRWLSIIYPANSVKQISGLWDKYTFTLMGEEFTLGEIDSQILRLKFNDPRAFFALSYASKGNPPLRNEPFYGNRLDEQLDSQIKKFINTENAFKIDRSDDTVYLSALLQHSWHGSDFVERYGTTEKFRDQQPETRAILNFLSSYLDKDDKNFLAIKTYKVKYLKFDWTLNEQTGKR